MVFMQLEKGMHTLYQNLKYFTQTIKITVRYSSVTEKLN